MPTSYLVTGATDHLGFTIVRKLYEKGCKVRALVLENEPNITLLEPYAQIFTGDIRDKVSLEPFFDCPSTDDICVIHCAEKYTAANRFNQEIWDVNVVGTNNIIELCKLYYVKKLVYVSSVFAIAMGKEGEAVSEPSEFKTDAVKGLYAKSKAAATSLVLAASEKGLDATVVLPTEMTGPDDYGYSHVTDMLMHYLNGQVDSVIEGGFDFVDVRDVADGVISAIENGRKGESYILSNHYFPLQQLCYIVNELKPKRQVRLSMPAWFGRLSSPVLGTYYKLRKRKSLETAYSIFSVINDTNYSHRKAAEELGFSARDMEETVRDTLDFIEKSQKEKKEIAI